jgi:SP family general alpha glucoside:H+ symporter-like MFS transporter
MSWLTKKWMWPAPLFIVAFFAPESPWWLVRKGRFDDAKRSLTRLTSAKGKDDFDADQTIAMMRHTIASEKEVSHHEETIWSGY